VLIDLVLSHTSESHPWFTESRSSRDNAKADWYVWANAKPDGTPPNNWLSIFGGSAWEWDGERMQYYLHNFLIEQPDLNLHNPQVQDELLDVARFWLDRGVDGFRLDTVNFYFHDQELRDNPPIAEGEWNDKTAPAVNPYNFQNHLYDKSRPENLPFLKRMRALMNRYPGITSVGEVGESQRGAEIQAEYTSGGDKLHMCYDFDFLSNHPPTGNFIASVLDKANRTLTDGWACWAFSNHDVVRHPSRWNLDEAAKRAYAGLLLSVRGSVCLYQGEELGLTEAYVAFEELQDPYGKRFWPKFKGRDGCRTPMPWVRDNQHAASATASPGSPWRWSISTARSACRRRTRGRRFASLPASMIAFRKAHPVLAKGTLDLVEVREDHISFLREHDGARLFCAFNLSDAAADDHAAARGWRQDKGAPFTATETDDGILLPPWQAWFGLAEGP
jgi:alpha-glucosidase